MLNPSNLMVAYRLAKMQGENLSLAKRSLRSDAIVTQWWIPISAPTKSENKPFLIKFILVFFYDILVYSQTKNKHFRHLKRMLETLVKHQLYAKKLKCKFATRKVEYLSRWTVSFVKTLKLTLHRPIGLNWCGNSGCGTLGINTKKDWLMAAMSIVTSKICLVNLQTDPPMTCHWDR
jgi:hypothetical protein